MSAPLSLTSAPLVLVERPNDGSSPTPRRAKIWELSRYLHCSVIGTCLSTAELRHVLARSGVPADGISDHELHGQGVTLAGQHTVAGKLLHKALDKRHRQAINQFAKARSAADLDALWREAKTRGDIPGAYWAVLTHPEASDPLVRQLFGEVHMLSHLVGAANRADIRRLSALETENAALKEKLRRQEAQLRDGLTARDATIRNLNQLLARRIAERTDATAADASPSDRDMLTTLVTDLERRIGAERRRRSAVEARLDRLADEARRDREARAEAEVREQVLRDELEVLETSLAVPAGAEAALTSRDHFHGLALLYVGGRPHQQNHLKALASPLGIDMLFHDGGIEERHGLLAGLVSRADIIMFPVDCVSHEAVSAVKRLCRQAAKPFVPLRGSGVGSFLAGLDRAAASHAQGQNAASATA